jgi:pimeloyl-ACP methyl ester carboxylesterase
VPQVELSVGAIEYDDTGSGPVVVLVHGVWMAGSQWREVVRRLSTEFRCVVPELPLGAHRTPVRADADLSLRGHAAVIAEFLDCLELTDVTLVFNDWCAAQVLVADRQLARVGRLALVSCETDDNYPPGLPGRMLGLAGKLPGGLAVTAQLFRVRWVRRLPFVFGRMSLRPIPGDVMDRWFEPARTNAGVRRDLGKYVRDIGRGKRDLVNATNQLGTFDKPVLVVWGANDRVMPIDSGRRLAEAFPDSIFVDVPDSGTLMPWDQPDALTAHIRTFIRRCGSARS